MKWLYRLLYFAGFILEVVVPLLMLGIVTPLVHGTISEGLTTMGMICLAVFSFILVGKMKQKVKEWKKGVGRALLLATLKIIPVVLFCLSIHYVTPFIVRLQDYAWRIIPIIALGLIFEIVAEALEASEEG
jgi:hypothetical protein